MVSMVDWANYHVILARVLLQCNLVKYFFTFEKNCVLKTFSHVKILGCKCSSERVFNHIFMLNTS